MMANSMSAFTTTFDDILIVFCSPFWTPVIEDKLSKDSFEVKLENILHILVFKFSKEENNEDYQKSVGNYLEMENTSLRRSLPSYIFFKSIYERFIAPQNGCSKNTFLL